MNVYEQTQVRLEKIFNAFDNVYVSFSGGKDSSALLYMCIEYVRKHCPGRKLGVFHMDYEVQYSATVRFVDEVLASNRDILDVYRVCVPFKVPTCTSMHQRYWRPWDEEMKEGWVREMPAGAYTYKDFPFFSKRMWDYDFQHSFARWLHERKGAKRTCCLVGIRTQESLHRWRTVNHRDSFRFHGWKWARRLDPGVYNVYPIYDWLTTDVWIANGKFHWPYNHLYDLYYQAGVPLEKQRVASPFLSEARSSLSLYRVIDPDMWGRMVNRVNGVNFTAIYATTSAVGWRQQVTLPKGYTWEKYMRFLLDTLPESTRRNYQNKLAVSIQFWRDKGGVLADETANPRYVAADLLSQAEHDELASAILITTSQELARQVSDQVEEFVKVLERREIIQKSLDQFGYILVADTMEEAIETANEIASEHLEIVTRNPFEVMTKIRNAGAIFIGEYSCEPLGDYFAGPNHILPTNGTAKFFSPLSVDDFMKKSSIVYYSREALADIQQDIRKFARSEQLTAHANSIAVRFEEEE